MYIYKITNLINNKIYIGQTIHSIEKRFNRHIIDSKNKNTRIARAIKKYGADNFAITIIDTAYSQQELNEKEIFWIKFFNSTDISIGYNITFGGDDTNTYRNRTEKEMNDTKHKLSVSKLGCLNPNSSAVKCFNIEIKEELFFDTVKDCANYFNMGTNHNFITKRCSGDIKYLFKGKWKIAYQDDEYFSFSLDKNIKSSKPINIENIETGEIMNFSSFSSAERYFNLWRGFFFDKKDKGDFIFNKIYKVHYL